MVILVIGLLSAGALLLTDNQGSQRCVEETSAEIAAIQQSINAYVSAQGRLPRPALVTLGSSDSEFGKEVEALPSTDLVDTGSVLIGSLPHTTLGLATEFASDCWGNKFTYAVTKALTSNDPATGYKPSAGAIILRSGTRAAPQDLIANAGYIIISHGADQVGATPLTYANITPRWCALVDGAQIDRENCDATNDVFFDGLANNGDVGDAHYDDVVAFEAKTATPACGAYGWGPQSYGQIGDGSLFQRNTPVPVATTERFTQIVTGSGHTCALNEAGAAFCWGKGGNHQLGNSNHPIAVSDAHTPTPVLGGLSFTKLSLSATHSCGLTAAGEVYCWGEHMRGGGIAATMSGEVLIPEYSTVPRRVPTDIVFSDISTGEWAFMGHGYTCGVSTTGQAYCWGNIGGGHFERPVPMTLAGGPQTFSRIFSGHSKTCIITDKGAAYCWDLFGVTLSGSVFHPIIFAPQIDNGLRFTSLSVGLQHVCGITNTQDAYCWGANNHSQLGNGGTAMGIDPVLVKGGHKWAIISAAENFTCAVTTTGQPYCWGLNNPGGSTPTALSGGYVVSSLSSSIREWNTAFIACGTPPPPPCKLYSQPSGGDPASCCNGDMDGDGICGSPPTARPCYETFDLYHTEQADCSGAISTPVTCPIGEGADAASYGSPSTPAHCGYGCPPEDWYDGSSGFLTSLGTRCGGDDVWAIEGLKWDWAIKKCRPCSTLTPCRADGQPSGGNPSNCCDGDNDGDGICGRQPAPPPPCMADGEAPNSNRACCNADIDDNGKCGVQQPLSPPGTNLGTCGSGSDLVCSNGTWGPIMPYSCSCDYSSCASGAGTLQVIRNEDGCSGVSATCGNGDTVAVPDCRENTYCICS